MDETAIVEREQGLHKGLTQSQVVMIGLGGAIGTGLFMGSGLAIAMRATRMALMRVFRRFFLPYQPAAS